jgi:uncharacterized protein YecT (DUF1311 family)
MAFQASAPSQTKPYSNTPQPVHSWDVFMADPQAIAAAKQLKGNCGDAADQATMNACFKAEYAKADASLHATYLRYLKILKETDKANLINVQNVWLKYRDAECKVTSSQYEGGSMQPTQFYGCMQSLTSRRQVEIKNDYADSYGE